MNYPTGYELLPVQDFKFDGCGIVQPEVLKHTNNPDDYVTWCPNCLMVSATGKTAEEAVQNWNLKMVELRDQRFEPLLSPPE